MKTLKNTSFSIILLLVASTLLSQKKNTFTFSIGTSIPVGSFARSTIASATVPSSTGAGLFINALFKKNISSSHFELAGLLGLQTNVFNTNAVIENYIKKNQPFNGQGKIRTG